MNIKNLFKRKTEIEFVKEGDPEYEELCKEHDLYIVYDKPSYLIMKLNTFPPTTRKNILKALWEFAHNSNSSGFLFLPHCVNCYDKDNIDFSILRKYYDLYKQYDVIIKDIEYIKIDWEWNFDYLLIKCTPTKEIYNKNIKD